MRFNLNSKLLGAASALAFFAATAALSDPVTLRTNNGDAELTGEIVSFDEVNYVIDTSGGQFTIRADSVTCEGADCPTTVSVARNAAQTDTVVISGSDTVGDGLMPILLSGYAGFLNADEQFMKPEGAIEGVSMFVGDEGFGDELASFLVRSSISSDAFANLLGGSADIGMASRRIREDEASTLLKYGAGDMLDPANEHIVAIDNLVVVTHPNNNIDTLTMENVRRIYNGQITNWSQVGGANAPINVVSLGEGSGTRSVFEQRVFEGNVNGTPASPVAASGNSQAADIVAEDEHAIGYVSGAFVRGAQPVTLISDCNIPMRPDAFSARTEEYDLGRFLYLYSRGDNINPDVRNFVDFATSSDADVVVAKTGFIDLGVSRQSQSQDSARAQALLSEGTNAAEQEAAREMLADMIEHDRLSTTFRFPTGSQNLTRRGVLNLARLTDYLEGQPEGTKIQLVGFADSVGPFSNNMALAQRRSSQIARALQDFAGDRLDHVEIATNAYGELAPASCNTTENGRSINRRVEVWINTNR